MLIFLTCMIQFQVYMLTQTLVIIQMLIDSLSTLVLLLIITVFPLAYRFKQNKIRGPLSNSLRNNSRNGFAFSAIHYTILGKLKIISSFFFLNQSNFFKCNITFSLRNGISYAAFMDKNFNKMKCLPNFGKQYITVNVRTGLHLLAGKCTTHKYYYTWLNQQISMFVY